MENKRIAAIHDLSCFGRCALTVVIPALSAMGNQVIPVPTALLSTHTGGFDGLYFLDLTEQMRQISDHFRRLGIKFDAIYTGFLGSAPQIKIVKEFIENFRGENTAVLVDPVMGDDGQLYSTYTDEMAREISKLCSAANIITPNLTEACILTGTEYRETADWEEKRVREYLHVICEKLATFVTDKIVITGIRYGKTLLATFGSEKTVCGRTEFMYSVGRVSVNYPGTGDLFACVLLGGLIRGDDFSGSVKNACDFTKKVMEYTKSCGSPVRNGVAFEGFLGELA